MKRAQRDNIYQIGWPKDFVVFNDGPLSFEPIGDADIRQIEVKPGSRCASQAWSCDCKWYFVIRHRDILLLNVYTSKGFLCVKKSAMFIKAFLDAPIKRGQRFKKKSNGS
jgi:hypothetical protein